MATGEFDLIARHFCGLGAVRDDVVRGIGDDAALLTAGSAKQVGVAWDSVAVDPDKDPRIAGEHCAESAFRRLIDEGASPAWLTLALSMENSSDDWVAAFASGVDRACSRHGVCLVGGDTTAGPATATLFATGPMKDR